MLGRLQRCHPAVEGERDCPLESEVGRGVIVLGLLPAAVRHLVRQTASVGEWVGWCVSGWMSELTSELVSE